jgi:DNA (cytosine-5)-methyltransferase 1
MKVGTFFSGVGSPEQALRNLDIKHEIEFACDIDKYAKETYLKNFKPKLFAEDITTLDMEDLPYVDLLVFGFPCQSFSMAGKRKGFEDTRGTLFYDALRYLQEHNPRYFIAENVKGLLSHDNGKTFQTIIDCLAKTTNYQMSLMPFENLGYHIHYKVLNTKDFGIPQNRERIFIVGIRDDEDNNFNFPKEILLELKLKDILQDNPLIEIDKKYYLSDKAIAKCEKSNANKNLSKKGLDEISRTLIAGYYKTPFDGQYISHSLYPRSSKTGKGGTGHLSKSDGTSYCLDTGNAQAIELKEDFRSVNAVNKKYPMFGRYNKTPNISSCLNSVDLMGVQYNRKIRRLTPIECERLQGFPDNFTAGISDTQRYKQMGNTITVNVIQAIIKKLIG